MKTLKSASALVALFCLLFTLPGFGQTTEISPAPAKRTIGLSANVQHSEAGILVPIFLNQRFVLAPAIGLIYAENVGTDLSVALVPKLYYSTERFAPYSTLRVGALFNMPENGGDTQTDYLAGIGTGAEYFLIPNFSFGVEGQLNFVFSGEESNRFGNPGGTNINLGTLVSANIYFTR
jgi:hypothetical protein